MEDEERSRTRVGEADEVRLDDFQSSRLGKGDYEGKSARAKQRPRQCTHFVSLLNRQVPDFNLANLLRLGLLLWRSLGSQADLPFLPKRLPQIPDHPRALRSSKQIVLLEQSRDSFLSLSEGGVEEAKRSLHERVVRVLWRRSSEEKDVDPRREGRKGFVR